MYTHSCLGSECGFSHLPSTHDFAGGYGSYSGSQLILLMIRVFKPATFQSEAQGPTPTSHATPTLLSGKSSA